MVRLEQNIPEAPEAPVRKTKSVSQSDSQQVIEVEITLSTINNKLNYIINKLDSLQ